MKKPNGTASKATIMAYAKSLYERKGQSAVFDYANELPADVINWWYCNGCETSSPSIEGVCMVCGQPVIKPKEIGISEDKLNTVIEGLDAAISCAQAAIDHATQMRNFIYKQINKK